MIPKLILQPIVENAYIHGIKPKNGNGCISIETQVTGEDLEISVMDNGIGMNQAALEKIQELLQGDDPGIKNEYNWQSIGMKNIHDRLRYLYGEKYGIQVTSNPNVGTIVSVRMPVTRGVNMIRMIIADDEPIITAGIRKLVNWNELGIEIVGQYMDGKSALEGIIAHRPDIALLDISMPEMTGVEVLKECRLLELPSRVVFISGFQDFEYAKAGIRYGAVDYLLKPIIREELLTAIGKCISQLEQKLIQPLNGEEETEDYRGLFAFGRRKISAGLCRNPAAGRKKSLHGKTDPFFGSQLHRRISGKAEPGYYLYKE